jgi:hypothetical protein
MCIFCEVPKGHVETKELEIPHLDESRIIKGNVVYLQYEAYSVDSSFSGEWEINYCPMCGRELHKS